MKKIYAHLSYIMVFKSYNVLVIDPMKKKKL